MKRSRISIVNILIFLSSLGAVYGQDVIVTDISSTPTTCGGGADGTISITVSGGVGQYSYLMVKGALPVEVAGPLNSNTYTFTGHEKYNNYLIIVSDESETTADVNYYIGIDGPDPIVITSAIANNISCNGANDGSITVTADGEDDNLIYDLTGPQNETSSTGTFTGLQAGNYTVTVSHATCPSTAVSGVLSISNPSPVSVSVDAFSNVACNGDNTGSISITPSGGTPGGGSGYTYSWTGPNGFTSALEDISDLEAGDYSVIVYDANMCSASAGPVNLSEPAELTAILAGSNDVSCYGASDGTASVSPGGGTGGYSYSWIGQFTGFVSNDQNPINLVADTYDLILSDNSGCSKTYTGFVIINEPLPIEVSVVSTTDVTCPGGSDGSASITPSGGTGPYSFAWTGSSSGYSSGDEDPSGMPADDFNLVITDNNGCTQIFTGILTINQPELIGLVLNSTVNVSCYGGADGSADITVSGGTPFYNVEWSGTGTGHSSTGETPNDLVADTYDVLVTDGSGCSRTFPGYVTITQPGEITVTVDNIVSVNCFGETTGEIEITAGGGTPGYTYLWSGPNGFTATTRNISNLEAGSYDVSITDVNGCNGNFLSVATISSNTAITATFVPSDLSCSDASDGAINSTIGGGTAPYTYAWTGPDGFTANTKDISGLEGGDYQLTVTDNLGCSQIMPVQNLTVPLPITAVATRVNSDCFGANNGSIDLSSAGGTTPHFFAWTGPNGFTSNTEDISNLEPGVYSVSITDSNGCLMSFPDIVTISEPSEIQASAAKTDISCGGYSDGAISITVIGGTTPYVFAWTGPGGFVSSEQDISALDAGSYNLSITDGNACIMNFPGIAEIIEPTPISATLVDQENQLCNGENNGSIKIDASGGIAPLLFDWTNSAGISVSSDEDPSGLLADTYTLTVSDQNGCSMVYPDMVTITEPPLVISTLSGTNITCFGYNDGSISVSATGGNGPYFYSIDGSSYQPGTDFNGLTAGLYTIWTRDANSCIVSDTVTIIEPEVLQVVDDSRVVHVRCNGEANGSIAIDEVSGGTGPYYYSINNGTDFSPENEFLNLPPGNYQTLVMDFSGCTALGSLNAITEPAPLLIGAYAQDDISSCFDSPEGRIQITGAGGSGGYSYTLDETQTNTTGEFLNLPAGSHNISIEDLNSCTKDTAVVIIAPPAIVVNLLDLTDVTGCYGDSTGAIDITGSGGTGSITYSLDGINFQATGIFNNLWAGDHTLTLRDDNDCTLDTSITLSQPEAIVATITKTDATYGNPGSIEINETSGGTPLYEYSINGEDGPFSSQTLYENLEVGSYHVVVRDGIGCTYEEMVVISDILPLDVLVNLTDISCFGESDGSIEMLPQDAEGSVEYSIDSGVTFVPEALFENLAPNTYNLVALDAAGKLFTGTATITEPPELSLSESISPAECNAFSPTGAIDITLSGGTPGYSYLWSDGSTDEDRSAVAMGSYTLVSQDANGCTRTDIFNVGSLVSVYAFAGEDTTICPGSSIQLEGQGGNTPSWSPVDFLSDPDIANPMAIGVTENTTYILTITEEASAFGCFNTDSITIEVYPQSGLEVTMDTFVVQGGSVQLEATGGYFETYRWEPATGLDNSTIANPIASPQLSTSYTVYALNEYGCEESDSVFVEVIEDIMAYNVFSPNGDGINDFFDIKNADRFPEVVVEVYGRWGDLYFSNKGYDDGSRWDGTVRGKPAPMGTYYYVIIPYSGAKPITGNVTIIR